MELDKLVKLATITELVEEKERKYIEERLRGEKRQEISRTNQA